MGTYLSRVAGAILLRSSVYERVEADRSAIVQAAITVVLSSVAAGVGALGLDTRDLDALLTMMGTAIVTWLVWAALTLLIGSRILATPETRVDFGELARTLGFAAAPGLLNVFALFREYSLQVFVVTGVWMLAAMVVAVRQALDFHSTLRALAVAALAMAMALGLLFLLGTITR